MIMMTQKRIPRLLPASRAAVGATLGLVLMAGGARADTTINAGSTFTIDNSNTTLSGNTRTWTDTGTLTIYNGGTLQTWPSQTQTVSNNAAVVFAGTSGTVTFRFNDNDTDFMLKGPFSSTATGAQILDIHTGYNGNGDRESVTFNGGIPNGSGLSLKITFKTQTGANSYVNLPAVNTFTGPITLLRGSGGPPTGYLTIGGTLTRNNGNTFGSGTLNSGNYTNVIALDTATVLNYASSAAQTLSGVISGAGALQVTGTGTLTLSATNTYSGSTTVNSGGTLELGSTGGLKFVVTDASNNNVTGGGTATLNGSFTLDTSAVTVISNSWTLVNATTKSFGGTFGLTGFTGPVANVYTKVVGGQTWTFNKSTGVLSLSSAAIITSFGIPASTGTINQAAKTIALTVPYGTPLATLAPTFTLTSGTCTPASGAPPSPTFAVQNPATYKVVDGATTNTYTVTVSVTSASSAKDILTFGLPGNAGFISGTNITLTVPVNPGVSNLAPVYTVSPFATGAPLSGTTNNFATPQTYTVTAQDGTTKAYRVMAQTYLAWSNSASFYILTDAAGANLPSAASETNFPALLRLNSSFFDFGQAKTNGADIRFSTGSGNSLAYQIEQWDASNRVAAIWVNVPVVVGNTRQELKMYWGKADAVSESSGTAVFNAANGYLSVFHMNETVADAVGTLTPSDTGTTLTTGMIGKGRNFTAGKGINCGQNIAGYPSGAAAHSTEGWFRLSRSGVTALGWGKEGGAAGKIRMILQAPPDIYIDSDGGSFHAGGFPLSEWFHVAHTYGSATGKVYVNGQLGGQVTTTMNILSPTAGFWIGGWWNTYDYAGDIDEVRVSKVTRSANWIKLEYENQKAAQTLVGNLVQTGTVFKVAPVSVTMNEGTVTNVIAQAGGAQKVSWCYVKNGQETVLANDQFSLSFSAGRVIGNQSFTLRFKAVYPTEIKTNDISVTVQEDLPDPVFTLTPSTNLWDGRQTLTMTPVISNWAALLADGVTNLTYTWSVDGVAATVQDPPSMTTPGTFTNSTLTLLRSQGSGPMTVTLVTSNGGAAITNTVTVSVEEPATDAWVVRTPGAAEKPVNNQFFARNPNTGLGTIYYNGTQSGSPDSVFLKVYTTDSGADVLYSTLRQSLVSGGYAFSAPIAAGKATYKVVYGTTTGGVDAPVGSAVTNLLCGDAYIIDGQSNALATDNAAPNDSTTDPWIRTYGASSGWGYAISKGTEMKLGLWGWYLAKHLTSTLNMPICIINSAEGGTRIDQHQPNPADHSVAGTSYSIYASLYNRVTGGKLTHGIRGVFWHQGENNSGAAAPTGDYDYKSYQSYFVNMAGAWKQDFPNIQRYIIWQVMPRPCSMGPKGDQLREVQRTLPRLYSNMDILDTLGVVGYEGCHFSPTGYVNFTTRLIPLVLQDFYGVVPAAPVTAPNLQRAYFTTTNRTEIALAFDQNMSWNSLSKANFWLDKVGSKVSSGSVSGNVVKLQLSSAGATTSTLDYLEDLYWSYTEATSSLLNGTNGIPALTFADVPIEPPTFTITQWVGMNGSASPTGTVTVLAGGTTSIVYSASEWFRIAALTNDAAAVSAAVNGVRYTNTFSEVTANHAVQVSFKTATAVQASIPATVDPLWAGSYYNTEASAAVNTSLATDYLLGLTPTNTYNIGFEISSLTVSGTNLTVIVQLKDGVNPLDTTIRGTLKIQGKHSLAASDWSDIALATIPYANFGVDGKYTIPFTDSVYQFYKAVITP